MVTVKSPAALSTPQRLQSVRYQRPDAHLKHLATGQAFYSRLARRNGFDDALLTGSEGVVSESAIANIGFLDGSGVVWPDAPHLHGITMQLSRGRYPSWADVPARAGTTRGHRLVRGRVPVERARRRDRQCGGWLGPASAGGAHASDRRRLRIGALGSIG